MSLIFVHGFVYDNSRYDCFYDTGSGNGTVQYRGQGSALNSIPFPNPGSSATVGGFLTEFCSDNPATTNVKCYGSSSTPFFTTVLEPDSSKCVYVPPPPVTGGGTGTGTSPPPAPVVPPPTVSVQNFTVNTPAINVPANNFSRWNAASNPIVFKYQRKDFAIESVFSSTATQVAITLSVALPYDLQLLAINNIVFVNTAKYWYYGKVDVINAVAGKSQIIITTAYLGDDGSGFLIIPNAKTGYHIETEITNGKTVVIGQHTPDLYGYTKAGLQEYLSLLVRPVDLYNYMKASWKDPNLSQPYTIRYREVWDTGSSTWFTETPTYFVTYAAMQLQEQFGGNMANYVTFMNVLLNRFRAKWLTDFEKPTFWIGLPFEMSFIYSEDLSGQLYLEITPDRAIAQGARLINANGTYIVMSNGAKVIVQRLPATIIAGIEIENEGPGIYRVKIPQDILADATQFTANIYVQSVGVPAIFNFKLIEISGTSFADVNGQLKEGSVERINIYSNGTQTYTMPAGNLFSISAYTLLPPSAANPRLTLTIKKNGNVVFEQRIEALPGANLSYPGVSDAGAVYDVLITGDDTTDLITPVDVPDDGYNFVSVKTYLMQPITVKVEKTCKDPYVYLKWVNHLGTWDYWRFGYNQTLTGEAKNSQLISRFVEDWEKADTMEDYISRSGNDKIAIVSGMVDKNSMKALRWMNSGIKVQVLVSENPIKWQTYIIPDGSFSSIDSRKEFANVKLNLTLPGKNIQTQ